MNTVPSSTFFSAPPEWGWLIALYFFFGGLAGGSYFETRRITETWRKGGEQATVTFWRRPLTAMVAAFRASGFVIEDIVEPTPVAACAERFPEDYAKLTTAPRFLFVRLGKPHRAPR